MAEVRSLAVPGVVLALALTSWFAPARAQTRNDEVLPALLTELKGLRAAMEQMASAGARSQLLVGRLQVQESRINGMIRRLDTVRDSLLPARRELEKGQAELKALQAPAGSEEGLAAFAKLFAPKEEDFQRELAARQVAVSKLESEEAQLLQQIAVEQNTWTELSRRLDDLEKSLVRR